MALPGNFFPSALANLYARGIDVSRDNPWALAQSAFPQAQSFSPGITLEDVLGQAKNFLSGGIQQPPQPTPQVASKPSSTPTDEDLAALGGGPSGFGGSAMGSGPGTVGQAFSGFSQGSAIPGGGITGLTGSGPLSALTGLGNLGLAAAGMVAPSPQSLFTVANFGAGKLGGMNVDPTTGLMVGSQAFRGLTADPLFSSFIDMSMAPTSPTSAAKIAAITAGQSGFGLSPAALGTPFGMPALTGLTGEGGLTGLTGLDTEGNVVPAGALTGIAPTGSTNFGEVGGVPGVTTSSEDPGVVGLGIGEPGTASGGPAGSAGGGVGGVGDSGPGPSAGAPGAGPGEGGEFKKGGYVRGDKDKKKGIKVHGGEFVVNKKATDKHRGLLEALNLLGDKGKNLDDLVKKAQTFFDV